MKIEIKAEPRSVQGTGASRRLRRESKVPGVLYGAGKDAQSIEVDHKELWFKLKMESFHASILDMDVGGEKSQVLLRDYQMHPFRPIILHVDFQRVDPSRKLHVKVPLHFVNAENSPGVKVAGGQVQHVMHELEIACLPKDLPEGIEIDLSSLQAGHSLHLSAVKLPAGVDAIVPKGEDPTVATIVIPKVMTADEEAAELAATTVAPSAADVPTIVQAVKEGEEGGPAGGGSKPTVKDDKKNMKEAKKK
ncbi:MAG: 50S ribosomal protein L25/general stress protein Ctc [Usitatibacter sp.]